MAISDLKNILNIFGGAELSAAKQEELYKEVLLMTMARAVSADINIHPEEVDRVRKILKKHTGDEFSAADIRVAARDELYAEATLKKYLATVRRKLNNSQRASIVHALADVFRSDKTVSVLEVDFFNGVVETLQVRPSDIAGLKAGDVD